MASKSAQPEGQVDVEELLDYIDKTMERLKTLYEQYFLGMQKQAPAHIHNDVERRIRDLMQIQIRNTGLRYRFATLQQKFGSYNSYWRRTVRQIEMGTYIRQLQRIGRKAAQSGEEIPEEILAAMPKRMREQVKRDREQAIAIAARRQQAHGGGEGDVDVDVNLDDEPAMIGESNTVRNAVRKNQHVLSEADGELDIDAFFASVSSDDTNPDAKPLSAMLAEEDDEPTGYGPPPQHVAAPSPPPRSHAPPAPPQGARPMTLPSSNQGRPGQPMPRAGTANQGAPAQPAPPMPGQRPSQPAMPGQPMQRPSQPMPGQRPSQPAMPAPPGQRPSQPAMPAMPAQPPRSQPLQGGWSDPQQRPSQPAMPQQPSPQQPQAPSQAGVKFVAPQRAGTVPGVTPAQQRQTGPIPVIPSPGQTGNAPVMRPPTAPSQVSRPNPIAPGASQRAQTNVESMQGPFPRAQTQQPPGPGGAPPRPHAPPQAPRPAPPGARTPPPELSGPPMRPPPGMNDADVNALYAKYVKAKQAVGEDAGPGAYGKLLKTINSQAPKIMEQYKAKGVEFSVVVKDNQVIIKAKPKP